MSDQMTLAQRQFLTWFKQTHPNFFAAVMQHAADKAAAVQTFAMAGLGATSSSTSSGFSWSGIINGISGLASTYLGYQSQQKLLNVQVQRAQQGLPPLNTTQYSSPVAVQVSGSPAMNQAISTGFGKLAMPLLGVGVAIALAMALGKKKKG